MMMLPVLGTPDDWRFLETASTEYGQRPLKPAGARKTPMGQQPVVADVDAKGSEDKRPHHPQDDPGPAEKPRKDGKDGDEMDRDDRRGVTPFYATEATYRRRMTVPTLVRELLSHGHLPAFAIPLIGILSAIEELGRGRWEVEKPN